MHNQDTLGPQLPEVQVDRLPCQEVDRYGVRTEDIAHYQPILPVVGVSQRKAGVAKEHVEFARAIAQVSEEAWVARYPLDKGIYLIKNHPLPRLGIARYPSRSQAQHGNGIFFQILFGQEVEELPDGAGTIVVGNRLGGRLPDELRPVFGAAVLKLMKSDSFFIRYPVDTEEAAVLVEDCGGGSEADGYHERRDAQAEANRSFVGVREVQ